MDKTFKFNICFHALAKVLFNNVLKTVCWYAVIKGLVRETMRREELKLVV
jgi:hypothetical protein